MRRGALIFGIALSLAISWGFAQSRQTNRTGDVIVQTQQANDDVMVEFVTSSVAVAGNVVMVDLSSNDYQHVAKTGGAVISQIDTDLIMDDTASGTIKYGVMASSNITGSLGSVKWFHTVYFDSSTALSKQDRYEPFPAALKTKINFTRGTSASSVYFLTNDVTDNSANFATTTSFSAPYGTVNLKEGDIIMRVNTINGTLNYLTSRIYYHTEE